MWGKLLSWFGGDAISAIGNTVAKFTGDKVQQEGNRHEEQMGLREQVAAEAMAGAQRATWWDSFVDGLSRLVRPVFTFGTAGLFGWCAVDPITFSASMTALQLVPDPLWMILGTIVVFWFGQRTLEGMKAGKIDPGRVAAVLGQMQAIRDLEPPANDTAVPDTATPAIPERQYQAAMADTGRPLDNAVILEWNRRRKAAGR